MGTSDNPAGAIYGTIVVLAAIVAGGAARGATLRTILIEAVGSGAVFWLAHVYTDVIATRVQGSGAALLTDVRGAMREQSAILEAVLLPGLALLLGVIGVLDRDTAINVALAVGLLDLFVWGIAHGRAAGLPRHQIVLVGLTDLAFGLAIVVLKLLLAH